ncbi:DUF6515 family protein [Flavobacteriaceae sp. LMIT009]
MKTFKNTFGISIIVLLLSLSVQDVQGQKRTKKSNDRGVRTERTYDNNRVGNNHYRYNDRYRTQPIRRHPHYRYPHHRRVVRTLPINHVRIVYRGLPYFYYSGLYYTMYGDEYIVVLPPRGFRIGVLPVGYVRVVVGPSVYFYHSGVYYTEATVTSEDEGKYEVTLPPVGVVVNKIHEDAELVYIDGKEFYEYNYVMYKQIIGEQGEILFEVVYSKEN